MSTHTHMFIHVNTPEINVGVFDSLCLKAFENCVLKFERNALPDIALKAGGEEICLIES